MRKRGLVIGNPGNDKVNVELVHRPGQQVLEIRRFQPNRNAILEANAAMRREQVIRDLSWARFALRIPLIDLEILRRKYPDLNSPDGEVKKNAYLKFCRSNESKPYRVKDVI